MSRRAFLASIVACIACIACIACDTTPACPPGGCPSASAQLAPERGVFLDREPNLSTVREPSITDDRIVATGLLPAACLDDHGKPIVGAGQHAALDEGDATYARLGDYAPATFAAWKARYGFPARGAAESLRAWRKRAHVYLYENVNELGLGRELGCEPFPDGPDGPDGAQTGVACFVTNYGSTFGNLPDSFADAKRGEPVRNTVCIAYIPSLPEDARVQFFVYGATGARQSWAQLDQLGPRPAPFVCTDCHGGEHDASQHLTVDARFLPTQPSHLAFDATGDYSLAAEEDDVRRMNALAYGDGADQKLTAYQREWLDHAYPAGIGTPGAHMAPTWVPPQWEDEDHDVWNKVVDPYCMTCHSAMRTADVERLRDPESAAFAVETSVCGDHAMPNAQQTSHRLWREVDVQIGDRHFDSPAAALLDWAGVSCARSPAAVGCLRDGVPDHDVCGDAFSGQVCLATGACGPDLVSSPSTDYAEPIGYCTLDGERGCPSDQVCAPLAGSTADGWDEGGCFACGRPRLPACDP